MTEGSIPITPTGRRTLFAKRVSPPDDCVEDIQPASVWWGNRTLCFRGDRWFKGVCIGGRPLRKKEDSQIDLSLRAVV